jgi:hypothetical protein
MAKNVLEAWDKIVQSRDPAGLDALLADEVVFVSPVVRTPQRGKAITTKYLTAALHVLNNETFTYLNKWSGETSAVLEFQTTVEGIEINGVDIIAWDAHGLITDFKVMVRPLKAINLLHQLMGARLSSR